MNYAITPVLENITLFKVACTLWNQDDIKALFVNANFRCTSRWQALEEKAIEKALKLPLPQSLKNKILPLLKPIGLEMLKWRAHQETFLYGIKFKEFIFHAFNKLCWTHRGIIDEKKSAVALINDENLDISMRYRVACVNCLEYDVKELWRSMSPKEKVDFFSDLHLQHNLVVFWTFSIKRKVKELKDYIKRIGKGKEISPNQFAFERSIINGNKVAVEYFLQKLIPREKEDAIETYIRILLDRCNFERTFQTLKHFLFQAHHVRKYIFNYMDNYIEILYVLFSEMHEEERVELFEEYNYKILECFLYWQQEFFMEIANQMWDSLGRYRYLIILETIVDKIIQGYQDFNYPELFEKFWQQSPITFKNFVIGFSTKLLLKLFKLKDKEHILLIFKDTTLEQKKDVVSLLTEAHSCDGEELENSDKENFLEFYIHECLSPQEKTNELKEELVELFEAGCSKESTTCRSLQFLKDLVLEGYKKRDMEEESISTVKKLCNSTNEE